MSDRNQFCRAFLGKVDGCFSKMLTRFSAFYKVRIWENIPNWVVPKYFNPMI